MSARTSDHPTTAPSTVPSSAVVTRLIVRVRGIVPARMDVTHVGTPEQQLGLTLGGVLIYIRAGATAREVADGWSAAAVHARALGVAVVGRRAVPASPLSVVAMVRLGGLPRVTAAVEHVGQAALLRLQVGPVIWEVCDATAYTSMLRTWRQAARLLGDNPTEDEE